MADIEINGAYDDIEALKKLAEVSDVITYEFENISSEALDWLKHHAYVPQGSAIIKAYTGSINREESHSGCRSTVAPYREIHEI